MNKIINNYYTIIIFRIILGAVFIYASIDKIQNPEIFSQNIDNFHFFPIFLNNMIALILPWIELFVGICLIMNIFISGASVITIALYMIFIIILSQAVLRGIDVHCGCFKVNNDTITNFKYELINRIILDFISLFMAFVVYKNCNNLKAE